MENSSAKPELSLNILNTCDFEKFVMKRASIKLVRLNPSSLEDFRLRENMTQEKQGHLFSNGADNIGNLDEIDFSEKSEVVAYNIWSNSSRLHEKLSPISSDPDPLVHGNIEENKKEIHENSGTQAEHDCSPIEIANTAGNEITDTNDMKIILFKKAQKEDKLMDKYSESKKSKDILTPDDEASMEASASCSIQNTTISLGIGSSVKGKNIIQEWAFSSPKRKRSEGIECKSMTITESNEDIYEFKESNNGYSPLKHATKPKRVEASKERLETIKTQLLYVKPSNANNIETFTSQHSTKGSGSEQGTVIPLGENGIKPTSMQFIGVSNALKKDEACEVLPLKTNKYANQCPYCLLWKLKSAFNDHAKLCGANSQSSKIKFTSSGTKSIAVGKTVNKKLPQHKNLLVKSTKLTKDYNTNKALKQHLPTQLAQHTMATSRNNEKVSHIVNPNYLINMQIKSEFEPNSDGDRIQELNNTNIKSFFWNFEKDVLDMFQSVRNSATGFDVTLACWDNQTKKINLSHAHKLLLSASSPVLRTILYVNTLKNNTNSFVYLNGVEHRDVCHILEFIYKGKVHITQQDLRSFMASAKLLKIKGVCSENKY